MSDAPPPNEFQPDDVELINNAILFCQDSMKQLTHLRGSLGPMTTSPAMVDIMDAIGQLQNSMLDLLNWAGRVNERLADPSPK